MSETEYGTLVHLVYVCDAIASGREACEACCGANLCDKKRRGNASTEVCEVTCEECLKLMGEEVK